MRWTITTIIDLDIPGDATPEQAMERYGLDMEIGDVDIVRQEAEPTT